MVNLSSVDYKIYCPSYKRSQIAFSHKLFKPESFCYVVREEEAELYKKFDRELMIIPKEKVSNISETRNWILENKKSKYVTMVDDDMSSLNWMLKRNQVALNADEIDYHIRNGYLMAEDCAAGMWGMNINSDPKCYLAYMPLSFSLIVLGPFVSFLDTELRYDNKLTLKEDYDMFLQQLKKHRKVLRFNYLNYVVDHFDLQGGCQTYRSKDKELEQNEMLKRKWGTDIFKENYRHEGSVNLSVKKVL